MANVPNEKELFDVSGPHHLQHVDWTEPNHRSSIAASLTRGVYILEQERNQNRVDQLAPRWWKFFSFELEEKFIDNNDASICGAIFKYQPRTLREYLDNENDNIPSQGQPPKYVIAFRGVILKPDTRCRDLIISTRLVLDGLTLDSRYKTSLKGVQDKIDQVGAENVWLAGHSLGAAIAIQIGKTMAKKGSVIESYLFNPPDLSFISEILPMKQILFPVPCMGSVVSAIAGGFAVLLKHTICNSQQIDQVSKLCKWKPFLFVNKNDPICKGYIGYFKHKEAKKKWGLCGIVITGRTYTDLPHFIPTAQLIKNVNPEIVSFKLAHGIRQWWAHDLNLKSVAYEFGST